MAASKAIAVILGAALVTAHTGCAPPRPTGTVVRVSEDTVEFTATVSVEAFQGQDSHGMTGYHLIVWEEGSSSTGSLFASDVSDSQVLDALEALGAVPGDALGVDTWEQRHDLDAEAPDRVIEGPLVEITVLVPGGDRPLTLEDFLIDPGGRGFTMRFGGHRANIPLWHSGCVACLYSCPGSKVGNASYTVREYVAEEDRFRIRPGALPPDGTGVRIRMRIVPDAA